MGSEQRPKRICFFLEQFGLGGTDVQLATLINHWPGTDDEIFYITNRMNPGIGFFDSLLKRKYKKIVIDLKSYRYFEKEITDSNFPSFLKKLLKVLLVILKYPLFIVDAVRFSFLISKFKFDILVSDNGGYPGSDSVRAMVVAAFLCRIKKRFILIHHKAERSSKYLSVFEFMIDRMIQKMVHKIIVVSYATARSLTEERFFTGNIEVIHNGIEDKTNPVHHLDLREKYGIAANEKIVGLMANIEPHKGHLVLVNAIPEILKVYPDVHFVFIGSLDAQGKQRTHVNKVIDLIKALKLERFVTMTGYLEGHPLGYIDQFDILVMPTIDFEGFGLVLAEAMLLKKPVVASSVGAIPEVIINGESGLLVPPSDPQKLAGAIISFLVNDGQCRKIAENARIRYEKNFTGQIMADNYFSLLNQ